MVHGVVWHTMGHDVEGIGKGVMEDSTILMIYGGAMPYCVMWTIWTEKRP